ncbi:MAG: DegT/DnrJ/EryC1/StrS family aminotransferase [Pseudobdellovibrionaceae bacterium]
MAGIPFIDLKTQYEALKPSIQARINKVLDHGLFVGGPEVTELEKELSKWVGCKHTLACSSGTDALQVALMAYGIGPGDEVITTAFSFIATAEVILLVGAKPIYVDIDPVTYNIDIKQIEKRITSKTKAVMPVSLYGQMPDMDELMALANKHNLKVIEDAAQSFGATYKGKQSGNIAHITGTSFFPAKPLGAYGDGGAIFTNDDKLDLELRQILSNGQETRYHHVRLGLYGRLDTLQCAILLSKLERYGWELKKRQEIAERYTKAFKSIAVKGFQIPEVLPERTSVWAQYTLAVPDRSTFQKRLTEMGVPTSVHYPCIMPDQPAYKHTCGPETDLSKSRWAADHVISLPMYPDMPSSIQDEIIQKVTKALS